MKEKTEKGSAEINDLDKTEKVKINEDQRY